MSARPWLAPLGAIYGAAGALRRGAYRRGLLHARRLRGRVISVGNLSVGGSGKTPVVAMVARLLQEEGLPVAVLSRGYGGAYKGQALIVADASGLHASAHEAGDEPVMLARELPGLLIAVGPRRDHVGAGVEARYGRRVHVLDDGFQHLRLHRDLDLLCAAAEDLRDRPLPAGRLREFAAAGSRADALLLDGDPALAAPRFPRERVFRLRRRVVGTITRDGSPATLPARPFLLAGIARPERFAADAASVAGSRAGAHFFPDHHRFTAADLAAVEAAARAAGAGAVLTTAKDVERLPPEWAPLPVLVLRVAAEVDDPQRLRRLVLAAARLQ